MICRTLRKLQRSSNELILRNENPKLTPIATNIELTIPDAAVSCLV